MRSAIFVGFLLACGPGAKGTTTTTTTTTIGGDAQGVAGYPATRWVPDKATYVFASPTVKDGQRSLRDLLESFGLPAGIGAAEVGALFAQVIGVDPLSAEAVAAIGVDVANGVATFSEDLSPTIVVKLSQPDVFAQFVERERGKGLVTQSVKAGDVDVMTTKILPGAHMSWAVVDGWLLVHVSLDFLHEQGTDWLAHARAGGATWQPSWQWAAKVGQKVAANAPALVGYGNFGAILQTVGNRAPDAAACIQALAPIGRVAVAVDGDLKHTKGRIAFDLGASAKSVDAVLLPEPSGWDDLANGAPLAVQWNLDVGALVQWVSPCARLIGSPKELQEAQQSGVRAVRAVLQKFDEHDAKNSKGAVSLDLTSNKIIAEQLDQIPMRSHLEKDRSFGSYKGHSLGVPMVGHLDYVLTDKFAILGIGEGVLDKLTTTQPPHPPVFAIDVHPGAMSRAAWQSLLGFVFEGDRASAVAHALDLWSDAHVDIALDGDSLVLEASGNRR